LRRARLVKNVRLESMVELFAGAGTGSGQIAPGELGAWFDFSGDRARDHELMCRLGELPSYDVYSLRLSLRRLDIDIDNLEELRLSDAKVVELTGYMAEFTRPLLRYVYGDVDAANVGLADLMRLFADPDAGAARDNLRRLAHLLEVDLSRIPLFLEDYADVYLSLSFYRQCLATIAPLLAEFLGTLREIRAAPGFAADRGVSAACGEVERKLKTLHNDVTGVLDEFRCRTEDMWDRPSANHYRQIERMVREHQTRIGEILCALTVKMAAWNRKFPEPGAGQLPAKVAFVISEMKHGLSRIQPLTAA
jgi:hypothetical protein